MVSKTIDFENIHNETWTIMNEKWMIINKCPTLCPWKVNVHKWISMNFIYINEIMNP
jgi:hypothetical protein